MTQQTIDFDRNAAIGGDEYDKMTPSVFPGYEVIHQMALACLQTKLPDETNLLVAGAGTGMELVKFGQGNSKWQILGVDPSEKMLTIAKNKLQHHGLSEQIKLFKGYINDLPEISIYDAATSILVMYYIPDDGSKLAFLQSIVRRMKPSSTFILIDFFGEKGTDDFQQMISLMKEFWKEMGIPEAKKAELLEIMNKSLYPVSETRVLELLQQAGFSKVTQFYRGLLIGGWMAMKNDF